MVRGWPACRSDEAGSAAWTTWVVSACSVSYGARRCWGPRCSDDSRHSFAADVVNYPRLTISAVTDPMPAWTSSRSHCLSIWSAVACAREMTGNCGSPGLVMVRAIRLLNVSCSPSSGAEAELQEVRAGSETDVPSIFLDTVERRPKARMLANGADFAGRGLEDRNRRLTCPRSICRW
jgi:hypothetical protein